MTRSNILGTDDGAMPRRLRHVKRNSRARNILRNQPITLTRLAPVERITHVSARHERGPRRAPIVDPRDAEHDKPGVHRSHREHVYGALDDGYSSS